MNSDPEEFERLRQFLALKRHEQPPPGYFNDLPRQVLGRIRAGESGGSEATWFQRFWAMLESKPIFAGAFGAAVCAILVSGVLNSEPAGSPSAMSPVAAPTVPGLAGSPSMALNEWDHGSSTNPISDLFNQLQIRAEPASYNYFGYPGGD